MIRLKTRKKAPPPLPEGLNYNNLCVHGISRVVSISSCFGIVLKDRFVFLWIELHFTMKNISMSALILKHSEKKHFVLQKSIVQLLRKELVNKPTSSTAVTPAPVSLACLLYLLPILS